MFRWHVSLHRLPPGHLVARDAQLLETSHRAAEKAARDLDVANAYLCRVKFVGRATLGEVLQVEELRFAQPQVLLFPIVCAGCGVPFQPLGTGRPPKKCPTCRKAASARFFQERARAARASKETDAMTASTRGTR